MSIPTTILAADLLLRKPTLDDIPGIVEAVVESTREIYPWMPWARPDYGSDDARQWIEMTIAGWQAETMFAFLVTRSKTGEILGGSSLNHLNTLYRLANLGYWVRTSCTRQGIASRAARLIALFGFEYLQLERAEIVVAVGNLASLRVAEKTGATREGLLRHRIITASGFTDAYMHSLIPLDFGI